MNASLKRLLFAVILLAIAAAPAYPQGGSATASLSGVVVDKDGGVIPGATVTIKNNGTGVSGTATSNGSGAFSFPTLDAGTYTVTVTLQGFKTAVINDVRLLAATPATLKATLEIGALSETVEVKGGTELVRTQSPTVSSTISTELISSLPVATRNALNFLIFLPGVQTVGGSGNARASTISGLPQNTINITIDGVQAGNNLQSTDGFFSLVVPRLDAVEEVTISTATAGADSSGQGATQIRFATRSGTNRFEVSAYEYLQHKALNTNSFFNLAAGLPRPRRTIDTYGGRVGGPIVLPGLFDGHSKAFFFFNQEEVWQPNETRRTRQVISDSALLGNFKYNATNPTTVNVLQLAAANGQLTSYDPVVLKLLNQIHDATLTTGTLQTSSSTNLNLLDYNWLVPVSSVRHSPAGSVDVNVGTKHHIKGTYYWQRFNDDPDTLNNADPVFPGFPLHAHQASYRTNGSATFRSTLTSNLVNEVVSGWQWSPLDFFADLSADRFNNQGGYNLGLGFGLSNVTPGNFGNAPEWRDTPNWNIDDNLHWLRGNHNLGFGFSFTQIRDVIDDWTAVPNINLGLNTTNDPAAGLFNTTNFPGASTTDLNNARALYALLTGRITSIPGNALLSTEGQYVYNGHLLRRERMNEYGMYASDSWRWKPNLTFTVGLRYELQGPMVGLTGNYTMAQIADLCGVSGAASRADGRLCNLFNPGVLNSPTAVPGYSKYDPSHPGYKIDRNNFAPNIGMAWLPRAQKGLLRKLLGDPEQGTISGGFTRSYNRERLDRFINLIGNNPGGSISATRGTNTGNYPLVLPGESWPILLRETSRLGAPPFPATPTFPILATTATNINVFDPSLQTPYTDSWSMGLQRALSRNMAIEARYIGNVNYKAWWSENWNTVNIQENGLLSEFKLAQQNLANNVAAGRGATFAYFGPGSNTSPLPIFLSSFTGVPASGATNPANYTTAAFANAAQFTNTTWVSRLDQFKPDPYGVGTNLWTGNSGVWRANALAAGLPSNFFVMNPSAGNTTILRSIGGGNYNSLQIDLRRRFANGLQVTGSYTYARQWLKALPTNSTGNIGLSNVSANTTGVLNGVNDFHYDRFDLRVGNVPHAFKALWLYDVPVGRGKRFGTDMNSWLDAVIGGWQFSGQGRVQVQVFRLANTKLVGMTFKDAQDAFKKVRVVFDTTVNAVRVWDMPQDIVDNTRKAYATDPTSPTGYPAGQAPSGRYFAPASSLDCIATKAGDCGVPDLYFTSPAFGEWDFKFVKKFNLPGRATFEFDVEVFNALKGINFSPNLNPAATDPFRITAQGSAARQGQVVWRVSW